MISQEEQLVLERYEDLKIQALMFSMDIDVETLSLTPKKIDTTPIWIKRWREKEHESDRKPEDYEGGSDERN